MQACRIAQLPLQLWAEVPGIPCSPRSRSLHPLGVLGQKRQSLLPQTKSTRFPNQQCNTVWVLVWAPQGVSRSQWDVTVRPALVWYRRRPWWAHRAPTPDCGADDLGANAVRPARLWDLHHYSLSSTPHQYNESNNTRSSTRGVRVGESFTVCEVLRPVFASKQAQSQRLWNETVVRAHASSPLSLFPFTTDTMTCDTRSPFRRQA